MPVIARTVPLLLISNLFMTMAWYAHLRILAQRPWLIGARAIGGIALFEPLCQGLANRLGHTELSLGQHKILQEVITLTMFVPFAWIYIKEPVRLNFLCAARYMRGAVEFMVPK